MSAPLDKIDPLTQAYKALWKLLEAQQAWARLVPAGNRMKDGAVEKKRTSQADFPEFRIVAAGGENQIVASSSHTELSQVFRFEMASGSGAFTAVYLSLKWACVCALANTKEANLGLDYVLNVTVLGVTDLPDDIEGRAQGLWAGLIDVRVDMQFNTADLQGL